MCKNSLKQEEIPMNGDITDIIIQQRNKLYLCKKCAFSISCDEHDVALSYFYKSVVIIVICLAVIIGLGVALHAATTSSPVRNLLYYLSVIFIFISGFPVKAAIDENYQCKRIRYKLKVC